MAQSRPPSSTEAVRKGRQLLADLPINDIEPLLSRIAVTDLETLLQLLAGADRLSRARYLEVLCWAFTFQEWIERQVWILKLARS